VPFEGPLQQASFREQTALLGKSLKKYKPPYTPGIKHRAVFPATARFYWHVWDGWLTSTVLYSGRQQETGGSGAGSGERSSFKVRRCWLLQGPDKPDIWKKMPDPLSFHRA